MMKYTPFRPTAPMTKAENTTAIVKALVDEQTAAREAKTTRLRTARLEIEAAAPKPEPAKKARKAPTARKAKS